MMGRLHRSTLAALTVPLLLAQQPGDTLIREQVNVILAPATVLDKNGEYVNGVKPSEFRLYDNDKLQTIRVDETFAPLSLVVAVQADAKVEGVLPKIQKIGNLLQTLVAGEDGEVAIIAFDHRLQKLQDFTNDAEKLNEALKKLKPGSATSVLTDAVVESTRMLRSRPGNRRRVLLLISESRDKGSESRAREALTNLEIGNVQVYALNISRLFAEFTAKSAPPRPDPIPPSARGMPGGVPQTPTSVAQMTGSQGQGVEFAPVIAEIYQGVKGIFVDNPVEVFTRYTGGKEYAFVSQRELERALGELGREIHNQYLITYNPTNKHEGGYHRIRVDVARRGLDVRTRGGYWLASVR